MKKIFLLFLFVGVTTFSYGQRKQKGVDIKVGYNTPAFNFDDLYESGLGFSVSLLYPFYDNLQFTLSSGYSKWKFDSMAFNLKYSNEYYLYFNIEAPLTFIPLTFGIKYYSTNSKVRPYFSAQVGFYYYSQVTSGSYIWTSPVADSNGEPAVIPEIKESGFRPMLNIGAGVTTPINKNLDLDFQVAMHGLYNAQHVSGSNNTSGVDGESSTIYFISISGGINYYFE